MKVLIVSRSKDVIESLEPILRKDPNVKSASRLLRNGHADPLHGVSDLPDVVLLQVSHNWEAEIESLNMRPPALRPVVLGVGSSEDPQVLRRAMRLGVRDFLNIPVEATEVSAALEKIQKEKSATHSPVPQRITAVLNAKGGSGATLLASNLSHIMVEQLGLRAALVDMDLQLGTSALCLNLKPTVGMADALSAAQDIDAMALSGYMTRHASGLDVLASVAHGLIEPNIASADQINGLLSVIAQSYDHVMVDLPRSIDPLTLAVMARADRILIVVQQHLSHLYDAKRIVNALRGHLDGVDQRLTVVINRLNKKATVSVRDIEQTLGVQFRVEIPNDYKKVCQAEDLGIPLYEHAPSIPLTKALRQLALNLSGVTPVKRGLLRRMFSEQRQTL
ncbi:MAG: AAA family ATPase [Gammaproteobacteria bacterium]|nr:AAA family ATPase [Gammaproteobacteria bacterium]